MWKYRKHNENADVGIDLIKFFINVKVYTKRLSELAYKHSFSSEIMDFLEYEWGKGVIKSWLLRDMRIRRSISALQFIKRIPFYYSQGNRYAVPISFKRIFKGVVNGRSLG